MIDKEEFRQIEDIIMYVMNGIKEGSLIFQEYKYTPKSILMLAAELNESISFKLPTSDDEVTHVQSGGYIMMDPNDPNKIYGIEQIEFADSYTSAPGEIYEEINRSWTRAELENIMASPNPKDKISLDEYLKISACIGFRDNIKNKIL